VAGSFKVDDRTGKLTAADLGVNYAGYEAAVKKEMEEMKKVHATVNRALKEIGITKRPLQDADFKKLGGESNAKALVADFEKAGHQISGNYYAYDGLDVKTEEKKARTDLANKVGADRAKRIKDIKEEITALQAELKQLEALQEAVEDDLAKLTKEESAAFFAKLKDFYTEAKQLSDMYTGSNWDFKKVDKYIKKK
jgi:chromosome segregation ATPase